MTLAHQKFKILHLKNGDYEKCIIKRNALNRVLSMHLDHFFEQVYIVFFKCDNDKEIILKPDCTIFDIAGFGPLFSKVGLKFIDSFISEVRLILTALRIIKKQKVNFITADEPFLMGLNAVVLSFLTGNPAVIYNLADFELYYRMGGRRNIPYVPRFIELWIEKIVLKKASLVITDRKFYQDYVIRRGAAKEKCKSTRTTTDQFYFNASVSENFRKDKDWEGKKVLFYFGRLHREKLTGHLIKCLANIRRKRRDVILLIAGDGAYLPEMKYISKTIGVEKDVYFLGTKNAQELVDIMSISDVLLVTHAGYSLIEMALSGKPIVAFDYEWHSEFIKDGINGILVPNGDYEAMAEAVLGLLSEVELSGRLGANAREKALREHLPLDAIQDEAECYMNFVINNK